MRSLVAQAAGVSAQLAGALQGDGFGIEHAGRQHQLVQLDHMRQVFGEFGEVVTDLLALGIEVLQVFNFKLGGDGHDSLRSGECGESG